MVTEGDIPYALPTSPDIAFGQISYAIMMSAKPQVNLVSQRSCEERRLSLFAGHITRFPDCIPAKTVLLSHKHIHQGKGGHVSS